MRKRDRDRELTKRIALICDAIDRAHGQRLWRRWRASKSDEREAAIEAMRRAIRRTDGVLDVTTDALAAAFGQGLRQFTCPPHQRHPRLVSQ